MFSTNLTDARIEFQIAIYVYSKNLACHTKQTPTGYIQVKYTH